MDGDRKYRQHGYQDSDRGSDSFRDRPRPSGPKLPLDVTGPKLPRLVQTVAAARCFSCTVMLAADTDFTGKCPKCGVDLHCCKQCVHFDSSTRFQCLKPISERIALKDRANTCNLFAPRVTVARDAAPTGTVSQSPSNGHAAAPRNANDARAAFDNLFKK
jgi:hypothetical protein